MLLKVSDVLFQVAEASDVASLDMEEVTDVMSNCGLTMQLTVRIEIIMIMKIFEILNNCY